MLGPNLSATRTSRFRHAFPAWLPGLLSYSSLLVINTILPSIAIVTLGNVATGLEVTLVTCNALAAVILFAMLLYKALTRSWVFNDFKRDRKTLFCVTLLDLIAAVGWSVRLDRQERFCVKPSGSTGPCHTALIAMGLALAWISVLISYCAAACADHGAKKRRPPPLPIHVSKPTISSPVIVNVRDVDSKFISFAEVPLGPNGSPRGVREMYA